MNKRIMNELYKEIENIKSGKFLTEEEFEKKYKLNFRLIIQFEKSLEDVKARRIRIVA